jgi:hypothetical protein
MLVSAIKFDKSETLVCEKKNIDLLFEKYFDNGDRDRNEYSFEEIDFVVQVGVTTDVDIVVSQLPSRKKKSCSKKSKHCKCKC